MSRFILALFVMAALIACGSETPTSPAGDAAGLRDATQDLPSSGDAPTPADASLTGCMPANCDDGIACTDDTCVLRVCMHSPSATRCAARETCDPRTGCVPGRPCGDNSECTDPDPCTTGERCDPATRVCLHDVLDGDRDGDPPRSCGGTDCDDSEPRRRPGLPELCDGVDNDCNGMLDDHTTDCSYPGAACQMGHCACANSRWTRCEASVGWACVDTQVDLNNCGQCVAPCGMGSCASGHCQCNPGATMCPSDRGFPPCIDVQTDAHNCGRCGLRCPDGISCVGGVCACPSGQPLCANTTPPECFDGSRHQSDAQNCGACGLRCPTGAECQVGRCVCTNTGFTLCGTTCQNTFGDPASCGTCGHVCPDHQNCLDGRCGCFDETTLCPGVGCRDLPRDWHNCGTCGHVCPPSSSRGPDGFCDQGECLCNQLPDSPRQISCPSSTGPQCINPLNDAGNCGHCGIACRAGEGCVSGTCRCLSPLCGGVCCPTGSTCTGGRCVVLECSSACTSNDQCLGCRRPSDPPSINYCCSAGLCLARSGTCP